MSNSRSTNALNGGMFSTGPDDWPTPQDFFDLLNVEFDFDLDPCAFPRSAKCERFFTVEDDGLRQRWTGSVFMNPPYGRAIGKWVEKAFNEAQAGATVVCLLPARTCTRWWHDYVMKADEVRLVKGRLQFGDSGDNAPFPNAVVVFRPGDFTPRFTTMLRDGS